MLKHVNKLLNWQKKPSPPSFHLDGPCDSHSSLHVLSVMTWVGSAGELTRLMEGLDWDHLKQVHYRSPFPS